MARNEKLNTAERNALAHKANADVVKDIIDYNTTATGSMNAFDFGDDEFRADIKTAERNDARIPEYVPLIARCTGGEPDKGGEKISPYTGKPYTTEKAYVLHFELKYENYTWKRDRRIPWTEEGYRKFHNALIRLTKGAAKYWSFQKMCMYLLENDTMMWYHDQVVNGNRRQWIDWNDPTYHGTTEIQKPQK